MIDTAFFHSTEFFVIATVVAALIVGFMAIPSRRGEARQFFVEASVMATGDDHADPSIEFVCADDGTVALTRHGLQGVRTSGMVNLAITLIGFDITINERLVEGSTWDGPADTAMATLDMMGAERYHVVYKSESLSRIATLTINNRPGFRASRPLLLS